MLRRTFITMLSLMLLAGCEAQSSIQSDYLDQQDTCREHVEDNLSRVQGGSSNPAASAIAGAQFSDCMNKAGWHVAVPKPSQVAAGPAPNPPTGSPSTNPSAATAATAIRPSGIAPSEGTAAITRQASPYPTINPPTGAPSVNPSAAVGAKPVAPQMPGSSVPSIPSVPSAPPAAYQPAARPAAASAPSYGTGAGRQF